MKLHGIEIPENGIEAFCRTNGIRRLALFGSILRDDFRPDSNVDVLVEFHPGVRVGYIAMARMARELSTTLKRDVDLRTPAELHPAFREEVLKGEQLLLIHEMKADGRAGGRASSACRRPCFLIS